MNKLVLLFSLFIFAGVGLYIFWGDTSQNITKINQFRHRNSKEQIKEQNKKYILTQSKTKVLDKNNLKKPNRNLAQANQVIDVANPMEKREELKKSFSSRGFANRRVGSLEPNSPIVYGDGNGNEYKILEDFVAVKKTKENENDYPEAKVKLGHFIVPKAQAPADALILMENASVGTVAIFTGLIKAKLNDITMAESLLSEVSYDIHLKYEHIGLVMYKFSNYQDTISAKKTLDQSNFVRRATIELLEYERIAQ